MDQSELRERLSGLPLSEIRYYPQVSSTNNLAVEWVTAGAPDLALVVADEQTAGRGRFARRWVTRPGAALAFSLIVHPTEVRPELIRRYSPWGALGLAQALRKGYGLQPRIKWPNDVLLPAGPSGELRKTAGILVETSWTGSQLTGAVIGIGINVGPGSIPPASELLFPATCVEDASRQPVERWDLLRRVLEAMIAWRPRLDSRSFLDAWENQLAFRGEWVRIGPGDDPARDRLGLVLGINPDGSLRLRSDKGVIFSVQAGELHLRPVTGGI